MSIISDLCDEYTFGALMFITHKNQHKFLNNALKEYDLSIMQALFLIRINSYPEINQNELAEWFFITKGTVAKSLKTLENKGFIKRERDLEDNRKYNLTLTEKSQKLLPVFKKLTDDWDDKVGLNELGDDFKDNFKKIALKSISLNEEE